MSYFIQEKDWGLGNFVMATPMIRLQSKKIGKPVPVFFTNNHIATLYKDADFINILSKKPSVPAAYGSSRHPKAREKRESDSEAYCRIQLGHTGPIPSTYVDRPDKSEYLLEKQDEKRYIAVFHGCLGTVFRKKKDIGANNRQMMINEIIRHEMIPVILGSKDDINNFWYANDTSKCISLAGKLSLRQSVSVLSQCYAFVSNDTGLYHVSGALNMRGIVFWHKTDMYKNRSTSKKIIHIQTNNLDDNIYRNNLISFLETIK